MARIKYVTRTVVSSVVSCGMLKVDDKKYITVTFKLPGDWTETDPAKIEREIKKKADEHLHFSFNDKDGKTFKANFVCVEKVELLEKLYWMNEEKFIAMADKVTDGRETAEN